MNKINYQESDRLLGKSVPILSLVEVGRAGLTFFLVGCEDAGKGKYQASGRSGLIPILVTGCATLGRSSLLSFLCPEHYS